MSTPALQAVDGSCKKFSDEIIPAELIVTLLELPTAEDDGQAHGQLRRRSILFPRMYVTHSGGQSFGTSAGWSVESHAKLPLFTIEDVKQNLFFSPEKGLCIPIY